MISPKAELHHLGGTGPPLLLIHGFGADRFGWAANAPFLMNKVSVWAVDLPGHGSASCDLADGNLNTLADAVQTAASQLEGSITLVGHSLGGRIALELATQNGLDVCGVVALAPAGLGARTDEEFLTEFPKLQSVSDAHALLLKLVHRERLISPAMAEHVIASLQVEGRRRALSLVASEILKLKPIAIPTNIPVEVFWGEEDKIAFPPAPNSSLSDTITLLPNVGHLAHVEAASKINAAILDMAGI